MVIYVEKRQEFQAKQFEGFRNAGEVGEWLLEGWGTVSAHIVSLRTLREGEKANPTWFRTRLALSDQSLRYYSPRDSAGREQTIEIPEGHWLVFNLANELWDILSDAEFQQNYEVKK